MLGNACVVCSVTVVLFVMFCYSLLQLSPCDVLLQLCLLLRLFSNSSLPTLSCQGVFQCCQYLGNNFGVGVVSHHSDPPNLASTGSKTPRDLNQVVIHGMTTHCHEVDALRYLDRVHCRQPGFWIGDKHLESKLSETSLQCVSSKSVSPPAVLKTLLGHHGQTLA